MYEILYVQHVHVHDAMQQTAKVKPTRLANASANAPASGRKPSGTKVSLERYRIESQRIFAVLEQLAPVRVMRFQPARLLPQLPLLCSHRLCSLLSSRTLEYRNSRRCSSGLASTKRTWT